MSVIDVFTASIVRGACEKIYGSEIDTKVWANWKIWADVPKGRTTKYTGAQFCMLVGIATLRHKNRYGQLSQKAARAIAYSDKTIQMVDALASHIKNEGWALGWDVRSALALRGYEVSGAMLKKLMPSMRPNQWYQVDAVVRMIEDSTIQDYGMAG